MEPRHKILLETLRKALGDGPWEQLTPVLVKDEAIMIHARRDENGTSLAHDMGTVAGCSCENPSKETLEAAAMVEQQLWKRRGRKPN